MTLDHSFLSDSRNFFVWPRVISVHSYYLTSLVTSHFCRLTSPIHRISIPKNIFISIFISLSAGSSYMSVMSWMDRIAWDGSFSAYLSSNGFVFPAWNIGVSVCIVFRILLMNPSCYPLSCLRMFSARKVSCGFLFTIQSQCCFCSPHFTMSHRTFRFCVDTGLSN